MGAFHLSVSKCMHFSYLPIIVIAVKEYRTSSLLRLVVDLHYTSIAQSCFSRGVSRYAFNYLSLYSSEIPRVEFIHYNET